MSKDLMNRFVFDNYDCRGQIVTLGKSYKEVLTTTDYPPQVQQLLGEFLAAVTLLSATLKFEGVLTLQARGDGAIPLLMAESNHLAQLRGVARTSEIEELPEAGSDVRAFLGDGHLVVTIVPDKGERYQGIIPLGRPTLAGCLEDYFALSEQLPTRFWLYADAETASGFLLQRLPQQLASEEDNINYWQHVTALADSVKEDEVLSLDHEKLLYRLYHQEKLKLFEPQEISFKCTCSRERTASAIIAIGADEVTSMLAECDPISVDCQFCNTQYQFNAKEISAIFKNKPVIH